MYGRAHSVQIMAKVTTTSRQLQRLTVPTSDKHLAMCMVEAGCSFSCSDIMAKPTLPDELWSILQPLLPVHTPSPKGGRPRIDDRSAVTGILFVLRTGIPWEYLPQELGCGAGMSCWRRLRDWQQAGVWQKLHEAMLHRLRESDQIEWERASIDSASVPSPPRGQQYWTKPYRSRQARLQASHHRRSEGRATGSADLGSQRS